MKNAIIAVVLLVVAGCAQSYSKAEIDKRFGQVYAGVNNGFKDYGDRLQRLDNRVFAKEIAIGIKKGCKEGVNLETLECTVLEKPKDK